MHTLIALPGLHGTVGPFRPLIETRPDTVRVEAIGYPPDRRMGYDDLVPYAAARLPAEGPFSILGESFAGPLALRLARTCRPKLVVLCATFIRSPMPRMMSLAPLEVARAVREELEPVEPAVLAHRVRAILGVDAPKAAWRVLAPLMEQRIGPEAL